MRVESSLYSVNMTGYPDQSVSTQSVAQVAYELYEHFCSRKICLEGGREPKQVSVDTPMIWLTSSAAVASCKAVSLIVAFIFCCRKRGVPSSEPPMLPLYL
jgi:hypothetical protein